MARGSLATLAAFGCALSGSLAAAQEGACLTVQSRVKVPVVLVRSCLENQTLAGGARQSMSLSANETVWVVPDGAEWRCARGVLEVASCPTGKDCAFKLQAEAFAEPEHGGAAEDPELLKAEQGDAVADPSTESEGSGYCAGGSMCDYKDPGSCERSIFHCTWKHTWGPGYCAGGSMCDYKDPGSCENSIFHCTWKRMWGPSGYCVGSSMCDYKDPGSCERSIFHCTWKYTWGGYGRLGVSSGAGRSKSPEAVAEADNEAYLVGIVASFGSASAAAPDAAANGTAAAEAVDASQGNQSASEASGDAKDVVFGLKTSAVTYMELSGSPDSGCLSIVLGGPTDTGATPLLRGASYHPHHPYHRYHSWHPAPYWHPYHPHHPGWR